MPEPDRLVQRGLERGVDMPPGRESKAGVELRRMQGLDVVCGEVDHLQTPQRGEDVVASDALMVMVGCRPDVHVYLMSMLQLEGFLTIIDHDKVEIVNLNRSPLFGFSDIGDFKVAVAEKHLRSSVPLRPFAGRYDEYIASVGRSPGDVDIVLPLANEFGIRSFVENNFPPVQVYGTTTNDWGINLHRHSPLEEDCSLCRFPEEARQATFICSESEIQDETGDNVDAALPFLSMGAAALTVAELLRLQLPNRPLTPNFVYIDFKGTLDLLSSYQRHPREACSCRGRSTAIHKEYIASSRFFQSKRAW